MKRAFLYLAGLTVLSLLLLWLFAGSDDASKNAVENSRLLPKISQQINDINSVEIVVAGNQTIVSMVRKGNRWQIEQLGGYQVDWSKLQTLLADLAQATVLETKTDNPAYYARLGVEDITAQDAGSVLVKLGSGEDTVGILVGHEAQGRPGQFVRLQHSAASALVDRRLDVPRQLMAWADSLILDITASEVAEVEVIHSGGETLLVRKISADQTDFDLVGMPQGREIKNSWAVNSMASVFSMLDMQSVQPADSIDWSNAAKLRLLTFPGMEILADMTEAGDEYLLRLRASYPAADVVIDQTRDDDTPGPEQDIERKAMDEVLARIADINQKVDSWAFGISKQKYDVMVQRLENLLKPLETE